MFKKILNFCIEKKFITLNQARNIYQARKYDFISENGYPLLHLICNKVDKEYKNECVFLKAAYYLISKGANIDILDKHLCSPLHYAAREGKYYLAKMLGDYGANINLLSDGRSALALALEHSPRSRALVEYLHSKTRLTPEVSKDIAEIYEDALVKWEESSSYVSCINRCIELNLASIPQRRNDCPELANGLWIRAIDPDREIAKLRNIYLWREHSSATFVAEGIPIFLFGSGSTGVIIKRLGENISYFYNGEYGEKLTGYGSRRTLEEGPGHFRNISEAQILEEIKKVHHECLKDYGKADRYGAVIANGFCIPWNEGLINYRKSDILGILLGDPEDRVSVKSALQFRANLNLLVPFYYYKDGVMKNYRSRDLRRKHNI